MKPIAIFYHCLFQIGEEILPSALDIVHEQMELIRNSGLLDAAAEMTVGMNGGEESRVYAESLFPAKAKVVYHGLQCRNECRTITEIEKWLPDHPHWYVLYLHSKGATHAQGSDYGSFSSRWRRCMMRTCVERWRDCVKELDSGREAVGAHWLTGQGWDKSQHYFAGTFFWATSNFLRTLPSINQRERIRISGLDSLESRYEAEVWLGNGKRLPRVRDMETGHGFTQCP